MNGHYILLHIHIKDTFPDSREQNFFAFGILYYIDIISACFHYIFQSSKFASVFENYIHTDQVCNVIFIFFQLLRFFSRDPEFSFFIGYQPNTIE